MNRKIRFIALTLLVSTSLVLTACGKTEQPTGNTKSTAGVTSSAQPVQELKEVKTWTRLDCTLVPFLVADKLGYFKEQGLKIVYTGETQPPQRVASILNGDNDVGSAHPNTLAIARAGGAQIKGVVRSIIEPPADVSDIHLQHMWWVSNKNGPIKTIEDIKKAKGKVKVGTLLRNACIDYLTDKLLAKHGIPKDKIEWITMPDKEQVLALKKGLIDIATPHPPFFKATEETGIANILITSRDIGGENAGTYTYYFSDKYIAEHPEEVKGFVIAIKKAERWINDNKEQANKWTEEAIGVPVTANHYYSPDAVIPDKDIQEWIDGSVASGALPKDVIKVEDIITHQFDSYGNQQ